MKEKNIAINTIIYMNSLKGLKIHKINNNNVRCIELPRNLLKQIDEINLIHNSGIYFLQNSDSQSLYVGQTDDLLKRLLNHNRDKEFQKVIAFTVETNDWSRTYIDYLEWHYINIIKKTNFWNLINDQLRDKKPNISEFEEPTLNDLIGIIDMLLFANNINLDEKKEIEKDYIFTMADSRLIYVNGEYRMLAKSILPNVLSKIEKLDIQNNSNDKNSDFLKNMHNQLEEWLTNDILEKLDNNFYALKRDIIFSSPSKAACYARGYYAVNGWIEWKNSDNKTLDDIYRK